MEDTRTEQELITEAVQVQDACNLSGVVFSFARAMERLCVLSRENGGGTEWRNKHTVCKLYADKILHLCGGTLSFTEYCAVADKVMGG
jgi:hypothetical protein